MDELIAAFSFDRVGKSGARFQPDKARWFNAQYMHRRDNGELARLFQPIMKEKGVEAPLDRVEYIVGLVKDRAVFVSDLWDLSSYFFVAPTEYDAKSVRKYWKDDVPARLAELRDALAGVEDFSVEDTDRFVHEWNESKGYVIGQTMNSLRLAVVGACKGPSMFEILYVVGRDETLRRIAAALAAIHPEA